MDADFYLASRSPRRRALLAMLGAAFAPLDVSVDETPRPNAVPEDYVRETARAKARAGQERSGGDRPVLGADTAVILDDAILGKPRDKSHARRMLLDLGGRWHEVLSAFCIVWGERIHVGCSRTRVHMAELGEQEIEHYWATGEPADKAGAYAIQGVGGAWVREIQGSYTGVVGLPLYETLQALADFGVTVPAGKTEE